MIIGNNNLFFWRRKNLICWFGFLVFMMFMSSVNAIEIKSAAGEQVEAVNVMSSVVEPALKIIPHQKNKRKAIAASLLDEKVDAAIVKVDDNKKSNNLIPQMVDGRLLAPDIARIVARGELIVAMLGVDTPPFFFQRENVLVGLEVDMATEIANALKVKVRFDRSAKTFNQVVDVVANQQADLGISKLSRTLARAQMVRFSDPYLTLDHALLLNRLAFARVAGDKSVSQVMRNYNGTIGVIAKSSFADFATINFPKAEVRTYPGWPEVIKAVSSGEVMSAYRDEFEVKRIIKKDPTFALTLRTITLKDVDDALGIAVSISDPTLLAFVNQFLEQQKNKLNIKNVLEAPDH